MEVTVFSVNLKPHGKRLSQQKEENSKTRPILFGRDVPPLRLCLRRYKIMILDGDSKTLQATSLRVGFAVYASTFRSSNLRVAVRPE
jgi:hypothetical protein